jgi:GAF domain/ANTAR domain
MGGATGSVSGLVTRERLAEAVGRRRGAEAGDRLSEACVELLHVDAAAISIVIAGQQTATLGVSSPAARVYDEVSFTFGEGPCLSAVTRRRPVIVADLAEPGELSWTGYATAMLTHGICNVWAVPLVVAGEYVGAVTLFGTSPGAPKGKQLDGALVVAEMAGMPLLDLIVADRYAAVQTAGGRGPDWGALTRVEVNQATGMLIQQLDVDPVEALARLRAHAYASGRSASDVAHDILGGSLRLDVN